MSMDGIWRAKGKEAQQPEGLVLGTGTSWGRFGLEVLVENLEAGLMPLCVS